MATNEGQQMACIAEQIHGLEMGIVSVRYGIGAATPALPEGGAHLLEHIVSSAQGKRFSGSLSAMTKRDETSYTFLITKEQLADALSCFHMNQEYKLQEDIMERERIIVLREIAQHKVQPRNLLLEELQAALFPGHGYGRTILGNETQVQRISPLDLQRGLSYCNSPQTIIAVGPWETEQVAETIHKSGLTAQTMKVSPLSYPSVLGRGERQFIAGQGEVPFVAGGWILPGEGQRNSYAFVLMQAIWEHRVRKYNPSKRFQFRLHLYRYAGVLTLDSLEKESNLLDLDTLTVELRRPFSLAEYNFGIRETLLGHLRQQENLMSRGHLETYRFYNEPLSWEELLDHQEMINTQLQLEQGVFGSRIKPSLSYIQIPVSTLFPMKKTQEEGPVGITVHQKIQGNRTNDPVKNYPFLNIHNNMPGHSYWTVMSSPLTQRYHALYRLSCLPCGRLLIPKDLPYPIQRKGVLESVRHEGWDTLFQVAYSTKEQMKEAVQTALSMPWPVIEHEQMLFSRHYRKNIELELKWKILGAIRPVPEKSSVCTTLMAKGVSLVLPIGETVATDEIDRWFIESNKVKPQTPRVELVHGASIEARFNGAAVICRLPQTSLASLIIQEAAFGVGEKPFPTLESMTREKGLSYRIVQSLCRAGQEIYLFWGIQCPREMNLIFYDTVREWLDALRQSAVDVEQWFRDIWTPFSPGNHRSILQLLRDVDRMGYYACPNESVKGVLEDYLRHMMEQKMVFVSFYKKLNPFEK